MSKHDWKTWKSNPVECFFCDKDIRPGDAYRLEVFYIADIIKSSVDGKERGVFKPISLRVHVTCNREGVDFRAAISKRLRLAATTHDHREDGG